MPKLVNSATLVVATNKKTGKKTNIVAIKKTGYSNIWINGKHYYYNASGQSDKADEKVSLSKIIESFKKSKTSPLDTQIKVGGSASATTGSNTNTHNDSFSATTRQLKSDR